MFCSNCGKTMRADQDTCPHCGASMGEERFNGSMYTSVQVRIPAEQLTAAPKGFPAVSDETGWMDKTEGEFPFRTCGPVPPEI